MEILVALLIIISIIYLLIKKKKSATRHVVKPSKETPLFKVSHKNTGDDTSEFTIDLNEAELTNRAEGGTLFIDKRVHKKTIEDISGFYGSVEYSADNKYCVTFCDGYLDNNKWKNGSLALISEGKLLFKKKIQRPNDCHVSNNGVVICCDWQDSDALTGKVLIFDRSGAQLFAKQISANLDTAAISEDGTIALFETCYSDTKDSDSIFIIDIEQSKIINQIERPCSFIHADIDPAAKTIKLKSNKGFVFEIDFKGTQTNKQDFEDQIISGSSVCDKLGLYIAKPDEVKMADNNYVELLLRSLDDREAVDAFGKDKLYRMIGEFYDARGDKEKTVDYWEKAIQVNAKVGIKQKLDALKQKNYFAN